MGREAVQRILPRFFHSCFAWHESKKCYWHNYNKTLQVHIFHSNPIDQMWDTEKSRKKRSENHSPGFATLPLSARPSCQSKSNFHGQCQVVLPECGYPSWSHPTSGEAIRITKLVSSGISSYQGLDIPTEFQWTWLYRPPAIDAHGIPHWSPVISTWRSFLPGSIREYGGL